MNIGKDTKTGKQVKIDLTNLIATRLLIQSNSGGGKSWLIRKLLEESHGQVQQIILDLEGEFTTLREEFDYLICGRDGDIPVNIKTADLLARRLLELNVSTVIDISELKKHERILFVKRFLDSLIDAPRKLWHPCLVIVDEAHQFCPQASKSESASSVIDLMTRGRKRGFCGVLATQRISKLHKDACAEANNRLIGRTGLDVDRKRASEELGFTSKEDERSLRDLEPGEFYAFGSSISRKIIKVKIGDVKTSHPEPGKTLMKSSKTPDNIKKVLKDVIDLPKEVEEELKTKQDMQNKIRELKTQVRTMAFEKPKPEIDERSIERARQQGLREAESHSKQLINEQEKAIKNFEQRINQIGRIIGQESPKLEYSFKPKTVVKPMPSTVKNTNPSIEKVLSNVPLKEKVSYHDYRENLENDGETKITPAYRRMLKTVAMFYPESITKAKLSILSDVPQKASTFRNGLSSLKMRGLIIVNSGGIRCTQEGLELVGDVEEIPTDPDALVNMWSRKLSPAYARMFRCVVDKYPEQISKEDLSYESGVPIDASTFRNGLSKIKTLGLIKVEGGQISLSPEFFER